MQHPDALRRFRVMEGLDELRAALDAPFERWAVFLHPSRRAIVLRDQSGPARVVGLAGTGKTVVALHRVMRRLEKDADATILLITFSTPLSETLASKLELLCRDRPHFAGRMTVASFEAAARELLTLGSGRTPYVADARTVRRMRNCRERAPSSKQPGRQVGDRQIVRQRVRHRPAPCIWQKDWSFARF